MDKKYVEHVFSNYVTRAVFQNIIKFLEKEMNKPSDAPAVMTFWQALQLLKILEDKKKSNFMKKVIGGRVYATERD